MENMNDKIVNNPALAAVREEIASIIQRLDRGIEKSMERANGNYLSFFEWNADEVYQMHYRRNFYTGLAASLAMWDGVDLVLDLHAMARRKEKGLLGGSLTRNSTNQMANFAYTLRLQVEQELIRDIKSLAHKASLAEGC